MRHLANHIMLHTSCHSTHSAGSLSGKRPQARVELEQMERPFKASSDLGI